MLALITLLGCGGPWLTKTASVPCSPEGVEFIASVLDLQLDGLGEDCRVESIPHATSPARFVADDRVTALVTGGNRVVASWTESAWIEGDSFRVDALGPGILYADEIPSVVCESCTVSTRGFLDLTADYASLEACGPVSGWVESGQVLFIPPAGTPADFSGLDALSLGPSTALYVGLPAGSGNVQLPPGAIRVDVEGCGAPATPYVPGPDDLVFAPVRPTNDWNGAVEVLVDRPVVSVHVFVEGAARPGQTFRLSDRIVFRPTKPFAGNTEVTVQARIGNTVLDSHSFITPIYADPSPTLFASLNLSNSRVLRPSTGSALLDLDLDLDLTVYVTDHGGQVFIGPSCPDTRVVVDDGTVELHVDTGPLLGLSVTGRRDGNTLRQVSLTTSETLYRVVDDLIAAPRDDDLFPCAVETD